MVKGNNLPQKATNTPPPELIERFLEIQAKEIGLREKEFEFRKEHDKNQLSYAQGAIQAEMEDRQNERQHQRSKIKLIGGMALGFILLFFVFLATLSFFDKDVLASDMLNGLSYFVTAIIAYFMGKRKPPGKTPE